MGAENVVAGCSTGRGGPELSRQDLSRPLNLDPATVVTVIDEPVIDETVIDETERNGHVERRRNPADRRRRGECRARRATKCPPPNGSSCSPTAAPRPPA